VVVLKTIETETHVIILAPIYSVPPPAMLGAYGALSLWLALLACWRDSPNEMSFHKLRHCIIRRMSSWHFVLNHTYTLRRDPPLAEPGKIAVQFFSLCFPNRESEHLVQCCSVTSGTASCTIYLSCVI
jgi:hypothetical protein